MTTPTPDQGALERARRLANRLAKHFIGEQFAAEDETCSRCVAMVIDALAAAEAKARAAAIEPLRPHLIARVERYGHTDRKFAFWGYHCKACKSDWAKDAPEQHHAECALTTPAQSEGK